MYSPINDNELNNFPFENIIIHEGNQSIVVSGSFDVATQVKLGPCTSVDVNYGYGCLLARASGVDSGAAPSGLEAGALYNWDADSVDTGQQVWSGHIIIDAGARIVLEPDTISIPGNYLVAIPGQAWIIKYAGLYSMLPPTDPDQITAVTNMLNSVTNPKIVISVSPDSDNQNLKCFSY